MARGAIYGFGVETLQGNQAVDFGFVVLRMAEVAMFHIDGMVDDESLIGPWAESQTFDRPDDGDGDGGS
jgi:hypothetical protein